MKTIRFDTTCGTSVSCFDYFGTQLSRSLASTDNKISFLQNITVTAGYNLISLSGQYSYYRGGMFLIDQTYDGLLALDVSYDPLCVFDYESKLNNTIVTRIMDYTGCQRFYFRAYGKKYLTNETIYFTRNYTSIGYLSMVASFNNLNDNLISTNKTLTVYGS